MLGDTTNVVPGTSASGVSGRSGNSLNPPASGSASLVKFAEKESTNAWKAPDEDENVPRPSGSFRPSSGGSPNPSSKEVKGGAFRKSFIRGKLQSTSWYHSRVANAMRSVLHDKRCVIVMSIALLIALFLPDMWTLCGVNDSFWSDLILTVVMVMFAFEFFFLCSVDATYLLSFFFFMDIVGTLSMIFDISFMLGRDNTEVQIASDADARKNLMLLRASRAARVGARAGRLSRVLRILRFLPFLSRQVQSVGMAKAISGQLANLLATRVACLTILLVMVIPLFDMLTFPQYDYSLDTWVKRLSATRESGRIEAFNTETSQMIDFYKKYSYGPYKACAPAGGSCNEIHANWLKKAPPRGASALAVETDHLRVFFNMHPTFQVEAVFAILNITFIIIIMVFSGLALSSVVTQLAVQPLESMLATVRQIATTVFRFSAGAEEENEDETYDIDSSSEMKLLEKVVQKLAIIADLQMGQKDVITDDMKDEDVGILNMMTGKNVVEEKAKQDRRSMAAPRKKYYAPQIKLEDFGVSQETYNSWAFNTMSLTKAQRITFAVFSIARFHEQRDGFIKTPEDEAVLQKFVNVVEKEYLPNPFHNFSHAADVLHTTSKIMRVISSEAFLNELEQFSLLIGAVGHDIGHPGVNNGFLSEVGHELALQYNDRSPLENMHCAKLYGILHVPETDVFSCMSKEQYKEARKFIIESILHTDMMVHQAMVKNLQMVYETHLEVFTKRTDPNQAALAQLAETELFNQADTKLLVMDCIMHSADVSNPCRTWEVTQAWAMCVLEEFFAQGDQEKMLGVPVQFLNDRDKLNRPNSQIGFLEFMIAPFFAAQIRLWPKLYEFGDHLATNIGHWEEIWVKEVGPDEESKGKVRARVQKVVDNLEDAKQCGVMKTV